MALSLLISAWLVGALGGLHCLVMCGGFVAAVAQRESGLSPQAATPVLPARVLATRGAVYHAGRLLTYTALGAGFGAAGSVALDTAALLPLQRGLYIAANVFLLLLALRLATSATGVAWLQRVGAVAFGSALPRLSPLLRRPGWSGRLLLGGVWGLVPCALVYSVLPLALFAGGAWQGAMVLLAFGLGTLPNLLLAGVALARARTLLGSSALRYVAAALMAGFALVGVARVLDGSGELPRTVFCLAP
jgi:sulfite exporter TauE/SafE